MHTEDKPETNDNAQNKKMEKTKNKKNKKKTNHNINYKKNHDTTNQNDRGIRHSIGIIFEEEETYQDHKNNNMNL